MIHYFPYINVKDPRFLRFASVNLRFREAYQLQEPALCNLVVTEQTVNKTSKLFINKILCLYFCLKKHQCISAIYTKVFPFNQTLPVPSTTLPIVHDATFKLFKSDRTPSGSGVITHIPTSLGREFLRGFDQAEVLAQSIGQVLNIPHVKLLKRVDSSEQSVKSWEQRQNTQGRFEALQSRPRVLLVDDVCTSGATLEAAAQELLLHGTQEVKALSLLSRQI